MHDPSTLQGENGFYLEDPVVTDGEIVVGEDGKVRELADLERTKLLLLVREPGAPDRVEAERLQPRDLLADVSHVPGDEAGLVLAGQHVVELDPRTERRDVRRIGHSARLDPAVHECPEWPVRDADADADRLQVLDLLRREDPRMGIRPAQLPDV